MKLSGLSHHEIGLTLLLLTFHNFYMLMVSPFILLLVHKILSYQAFKAMDLIVYPINAAIVSSVVLHEGMTICC